LCGATAAFGADLNIQVQSGGQSEVNVAPGATVNYAIVGTLSDANNEGLALFGLDLSFTGGALTPADIPTTAPMDAFASGAGTNNKGINNPQGFGGTVIGGNLIQVGGGQNTIMNPGPPSYPPYPLGPVVTGVAWTSEVLVTGSLTAPMTLATYTLSVNPATLFANVIKDGEDGNPFWATEAAGVGTITNLTIVVSVEDCHVAGSNPVDGWIDARTPVSSTAPYDPVGWTSVEITFNDECDASGLVAADFALTEICQVGRCDGVAPSVANVSGAGNVATVTFDRPIDPETWTTISLVGGSGTDRVRLGFLPADCDGSRTANAQDINQVINRINLAFGGGSPLMHETDINRSGSITVADMLSLINLLNGVSPSPTAYFGKTLPAMP